MEWNWWTFFGALIEEVVLTSIACDWDQLCPRREQSVAILRRYVIIEMQKKVLAFMWQQLY